MNSDDNARLWDLCNKILNAVRAAKGIPLVPAVDNPYRGSNLV